MADQLISMGFEEAAVARALLQSSGSLEQATEILLSGGGFDGGVAQPQPASSSSSAAAPLMDSSEVVILGVSQYTFGDGTSACTAIACVALQSLLERAEDAAAVREASMLTEAIMSGMTVARGARTSVDHLSVDDVWQTSAPMRERLQMLGDAPFQALLQPGSFREMFLEARRRATLADRHIGIVFTKPPETICLILPPLSSPAGKWLLFDSHSRPHLGLDNSYLVIADDEESILRRLDELFPPFELDQDDPDAFQIQLMYNSFESYYFQRKIESDWVFVRVPDPAHVLPTDA